MTAPAWAFADYADALEAGALGDLPIPASHDGDAPTPYQALRLATPRSQMRAQGTFFTSTTTADLLWQSALGSLTSGRPVIVDPACGAADLLLPAVKYLATADGDVAFEVRGGDIDQEFVRIAATRLSHAVADAPGTVLVENRNFLTDPSLLAGATHVVLNPPYIPVQSTMAWAKGTVNAAALFVLHALERMEDGTHLLAILPDVLRAGTRYEPWRRLVESKSEIREIQTLGQFDDDTDVHVFALHAVVGGESQFPEWYAATSGNEPVQTVGERFMVNVGPLVPHRHAEEGPMVRYITARSLTSGEHLKRQFTGRLHQGPIVLVNRTSRPGDAQRARARLWTETEDVAVENHLIVLTPNDGGVEACEELVRILDDPRTAAFLDERIRCRHLTVSAVKEIPWLM